MSQAIQRTSLTAVGEKIGRKMLSPKTGAAIKLTPDEDLTHGLMVGEGVETTLSGMALGFIQAWALGDANGIKDPPVLAGID